MIDVRRVEGNKMMKEFILFPWRSGIYNSDPAWVPPLIRDQKLMFHPRKGYFFEIGEVEFFLAFRNGHPVGRITAHVNHLYEEKYDRETGFFGFYESINDLDVARALFDRASAWLKEKGKSRMNGPQLGEIRRRHCTRASSGRFSRSAWRPCQGSRPAFS